MKQKSSALVLNAYEQGYAVPAFNYSDIWELLAIVEAAAEEKAVVYLATNMKVVEALGLSLCSALGREIQEQYGGSIIQHLDHATSVSVCNNASDLGYGSVMIDSSSLPLIENINNVKKVVAHAHKKNVLVEAEIGRIMGSTMEGTFNGTEAEYLANVDEAVALVNATNVDSLAVGIGNAHGFYKTEPKLNIYRLHEINEALKIPLVLHGGTGIPENQIETCIKNGIAKINVGTLLHHTYIKSLKLELQNESNDSNILELFKPVKESIKIQIKSWIRVCGCANRATQ